MVVLDLNGVVVEGDLNPSSDTPSHIALYKELPVGGVAHTHSTYATGFAQAGVPIPPAGTTHADYFYGSVPITRDLSLEEIKNNYELNTGKVIVETLKKSGLTALEMPGALVRNHGPFTWGLNAFEAAHNAAVLEELAFMAWHAEQMSPDVSAMSQELLDKHYLRKHGSGAYYGQN